eukprot:GILK01003907.1.p1 GENE.GILK01003907.1~~GILK01003907.1.p1  ORF type:complete len:454 (+),score=72.01 GILK01003907.1:189-1550(+)
MAMTVNEDLDLAEVKTETASPLAIPIAVRPMIVEAESRTSDVSMSSAPQREKRVRKKSFKLTDSSEEPNAPTVKRRKQNRYTEEEEDCVALSLMNLANGSRRQSGEPTFESFRSRLDDESTLYAMEELDEPRSRCESINSVDSIHAGTELVNRGSRLDSNVSDLSIYSTASSYGKSIEPTSLDALSERAGSYQELYQRNKFFKRVEALASEFPDVHHLVLVRSSSGTWFDNCSVPGVDVPELKSSLESKIKSHHVVQLQQQQQHQQQHGVKDAPTRCGGASGVLGSARLTSCSEDMDSDGSASDASYQSSSTTSAASLPRSYDAIPYARDSNLNYNSHSHSHSNSNLNSSLNVPHGTAYGRPRGYVKSSKGKKDGRLDESIGSIDVHSMKVVKLREVCSTLIRRKWGIYRFANPKDKPDDWPLDVFCRPKQLHKNQLKELCAYIIETLPNNVI